MPDTPRGYNSTFENEILQRLTSVETKLDMMLNAKEVAVEALGAAHAAHKRLDSIVESQAWIWRTIIAAVIVTAISAVFKLKGGA